MYSDNAVVEEAAVTIGYVSGELEMAEGMLEAPELVVSLDPGAGDTLMVDV